MSISKIYDQPGNLMNETIRLIKQEGIEKTAFVTLIPFSWLQKFTAGTFKNPSVNRIEHIYNELTRTKLI